MEEDNDISVDLNEDNALIENEDQGSIDSSVKKSIDAATGKTTQGTVTTNKPKKPEEKVLQKKEEKEEQSAADKAGEKIQDKVVDEVKGKVQDKAKELLGDPKKGKEELADTLIDGINKANANRATRVNVGQKASQVSTTVASNANVSPVVVSNTNAAVAQNVAPTVPPASQASAATTTSSNASRRLANGAGRGVPPASAAPSASTASKGASVLEEVMTYGRDLSGAVVKGFKESKNIRMLGLATLAGATGWAVGKRKDAQKAQTQEFNRQQAIRNSLMSDG